MSRHELRFPNESQAYRAARDELLEREFRLRAELVDIANASFQAVNALIEPSYGLEGEIINGRPYKIPNYIIELYDVERSRYPYNPRDCILMRAVATGQPIESTAKRN